MLRLSEQLLNRIRAHGAGDYPRECCGALLGADAEESREVRELVPLANQRSDSPRNRFVITPDDVRRAEASARELGLEVVGWYHSHPDSPALPSEYDRQHAWPWYSYVIVSVEKGEPRALTSWRLQDDRMRFSLEPVEVAARVGVAS